MTTLKFEVDPASVAFFALHALRFSMERLDAATADQDWEAFRAEVEAVATAAAKLRESLDAYVAQQVAEAERVEGEDRRDER